MLVSGNIPSLINGVSQQPASLRQATQLALQENCYPSVIEGLKQRPPTQHLAKVFNGTMGDAFTHMINRDILNRFEVIITSGAIAVFDLATGAQKTVNTLAADAVTYLTDTTPSTTFKGVTITDWAFFVNSKVLPVRTSTLPTARLSEALIFVQQGNYGSKYDVFVNGASVGSYTTSTTDVLTLDTETIAQALKVAVAATLGGGYTVTRAGSSIWITKATGTFTCTVWDAQGGNSMKVFQTKTARFSNLPVVAPDGFTIVVDANSDTLDGAYYVKFKVNSVGETFAHGSWQETCTLAESYRLDATTMPYALIHEANDTFTFGKVTWDDRLVGNDLSNPFPSFIGSPINDIFFYKNRLSLLSDENFVMSEVGQQFNFFRTTVTKLLDSDPIDSRVVTTKASILRHAVPFNSHCVFFSDQTQFRMSGLNALTPKSVQVDPQTEYECNLLAKPVGFGQSMFFGINKGSFNGVRELFIDETTNTMDAEDVSEHVPAYIPGGLFKLTVSTVESLLCALTTGDSTALYIYKYHYSQSGQYSAKKVQSAWCRMPLGDANTKILGADFIETKLYLLIQRSGGVYLEVVDFTPGITDPLVTYVTHLDRRITEASLTSNTYSAVTDLTTMVLPYTIDGTVKVVTRTTTNQIPGRLLQVASSAGSTVTVTGDYHSTPVYIGQTYTKRSRFSTIYVRTPSPGGGLVVDPSGRLQLLRGYLLYDTTGYFQVNVTPEGRDTSSYIFTGKVVGDINSVIGGVPLRSGRFKFGILVRNENVTIEITSDSFLPFRFTGLEWEGNYVKRSRGM